MVKVSPARLGRLHISDENQHWARQGVRADPPREALQNKKAGCFIAMQQHGEKHRPACAARQFDQGWGREGAAHLARSQREEALGEALHFKHWRVHTCQLCTGRPSSWSTR